jgi:hypothetical protein
LLHFVRNDNFLSLFLAATDTMRIGIGIDISTGMYELKAQCLRALFGRVVGVTDRMGKAVESNVAMRERGWPPECGPVNGSRTAGILRVCLTPM